MNQTQLLSTVMRDIELLDDSAKLQVAEMVLRSLRERIVGPDRYSGQQSCRHIGSEPKEQTVRFADLQGIGRGVWSQEGSIDDFIREERESWER